MWWVTGFFVKCTNPTKPKYSKYVFFFQSDPDQGQCSPHRSPSPTDEVFLGPTCSPPGHAPPPPPYMPPQPSIEEARQQMHSLLDDAFALVSPTSQGSAAGITLPGVNTNPPVSSPPSRGPRHWKPSYLALGPFPGVSIIPRSCADLLALLFSQSHVVYIKNPENLISTSSSLHSLSRLLVSSADPSVRSIASSLFVSSNQLSVPPSVTPMER